MERHCSSCSMVDEIVDIDMSETGFEDGRTLERVSE
jgi:hypothetical protein|nr:MAG TPA: hypothetical protein [Caudoviricetes sp.]